MIMKLILSHSSAENISCYFEERKQGHSNGLLLKRLSS